MRITTLMLLGALGCADRPISAPAVTRADSAGIEIVVSSGPDSIVRFPIDEVTYLLDPGGVRAVFSNSTPQWVRASARGDIFVLDLDSRAIKRFGANGGYVGSVGQRGGGPGELMAPVTLLLSGDTLAVVDAGKRAVVRWASMGDSVLPQLTFPENRRVGTGYILRGDAILSSTDALVDATAYGAIQWSDMDSPTLRFELPEVTRIPCGARPLERPPLLAFRFHVAASQTSFVAAGTARYEVWRGDTVLRQSIRREYVPRPPTRQEISLAAGRGFRRTMANGGGCSLSASELQAAVGVVTQMPAIHGLRITEDGRVWVRRSFSRSLRGDVDEFDASGAYIRTWRSGALPVASLADGRVIVALDDADSGGISLGIVRLVDDHDE